MVRLITEDTNRELVTKVLNDNGLDYTMTEGTGSWKGVGEKSLIIDFLDTPIRTVETVAMIIKYWNSQEAVLVLEIPETHKFV